MDRSHNPSGLSSSLKQQHSIHFSQAGARNSGRRRKNGQPRPSRSTRGGASSVPRWSQTAPRSLHRTRDFSARSSGLQLPDIPRLAEAARISVTPEEVKEFAPKISKVIDWFGQLQAVDLESVEPTLRADTEVSDFVRPDTPETFDNRGAILAAVPTYDEPYIKVPKVLNKE